MPSMKVTLKQQWNRHLVSKTNSILWTNVCLSVHYYLYLLTIQMPPPQVCTVSIICSKLYFYLNKCGSNFDFIFPLSVAFEAFFRQWNQPIRYNNNPRYLDITLYRTLSFKQHLQNLAEKLRTRNNIINKQRRT